jgi:tetrahydrodipicolinate N-succinyltransferase
MLPAIEPGFGIGVFVGTGVNVMVGVIVGTKVNVTVGVFVGDSVSVGDATTVGEADGICCTAWVNAIRVEATFVATASEVGPPGLALFGRLQALTRETTKIVANIAKAFFIGNPPLAQAYQL